MRINAKNKIEANLQKTVMVINYKNQALKVKIDFATINKIKNYKWYIKNCNGKLYAYSSKAGYLHRYLTNCPSKMVVDHLNGDSLDNKQANLRVCTQAENNANKQNKQIIVTGVRRTSAGTYRTTFRVKGKVILDKTVATQDEAIKLRLKAELEYGLLGHRIDFYRIAFNNLELGEIRRNYLKNISAGKVSSQKNFKTIMTLNLLKLQNIGA